MGNGLRISFWHNEWMGTLDLAARFPLIYTLSIFKGGSVRDMRQGAEMGEVWQIQLRRSLRDWERPVLDDLFESIGGVVFTDERDIWCWKWSKKVRFTVKSMYKHLVDDKFSLMGSREVFPTDLVWETSLPTNINSGTVVCLLPSEQQTLMKLYEADTIMGWFESWPVKTGNALTSKVCGYLPYATSWIIWKYRNNNDVSPSLVKMLQEIKCIIWFWSDNWSGRKRFNFRDMAVNWVGVLAGTVRESRTAT
ncbi:hypothetical protein FRX31_019505, partial [Thalictrum thalictroides]